MTVCFGYPKLTETIHRAQAAATRRSGWKLEGPRCQTNQKTALARYSEEGRTEMEMPLVVRRPKLGREATHSGSDMICLHKQVRFPFRTNLIQRRATQSFFPIGVSNSRMKHVVREGASTWVNSWNDQRRRQMRDPELELLAPTALPLRDPCRKQLSASTIQVHVVWKLNHLACLLLSVLATLHGTYTTHQWSLPTGGRDLHC